MREIGGYFGLEQLVHNEYHKKLIALNTGRNALLYLLKARKVKKLYIPYYLCGSVPDMCDRNGYKYECYNIDADFMPMFNRTLADHEYIYVVNYYGQITAEKVINLKNKLGQIIMDNAQAFFQIPVNGTDTIYSCRKYFGVPDGAYLSTDIRLGEKLGVDISKDRMTHILGRYEGRASDYYSCFKDNDTSFRAQPLRYMSKLTHNILGAIDYERVRRIRNDNYAYLAKELAGQNKLKPTASDGPFAYPLYWTTGMKTRSELVQRGIYIPILWPNVLAATKAESIEHQYAENILPLPCDQRYSLDDMKYLVEALKIP